MTISELKNKIICGDALSELKKLPTESIDCVITSPPYYGLRNYGIDGQIGLEKTFDEYLKKILKITTEIKRVLKKSGSFWLNMGDCYGGVKIGNTNASTGGIGKPRYSGNNLTNKKDLPGLEKCMLMQPERLTIKMIDEQGWILRNKIKWAKQVLDFKNRRTYGSVMPTSVKDRFNESGEELYFFVKSKKYYFDLNAVRLSPQTFENRPGGFIRSRELEYDSKYLDDYSPKAKQSGQRFNYRVRDAKRKEGQPQFKASEEEIKRYNEIPEDYGKKKLQNLSDKGKTLNRWMSGTPNFIYQGKFAGNQNAEMFNSPRAKTQRKSLDERLDDTKNKDTKSSRTYNIKKLLSEVRLGIKPNTGMEPNKVNDPQGNHEGGPGSWRENLDDKEYRKRWKGQKEAGLPASYIGPTGEDHNLLNNPAGKNLCTIWQIGSEPHNFQKELGVDIDHFAIFPEALCEIPILAGCPKGGIVLDPFMGSGTTAIVAKKLGRNYLGIELNPAYVKIAEARIKATPSPLL